MSTTTPSPTHASATKSVLATCLAEFNGLFGAHHSASPTLDVPAEITALRIRLVTEEHAELREALDLGDIAEIAKEAADLAYVLQGTADAFGIDLDAALQRARTLTLFATLNDASRPTPIASLLSDADLLVATRALRGDDLPAIADALASILWATHEVAARLGFDLNDAVTEVHASNLTKVGPDGKVTVDAGGKVLKPPTYRPADMSRVVATAGPV